MGKNNEKFSKNEISVGRKVIYTPYLTNSMVVNDNVDSGLIINDSNICKIVTSILKKHSDNRKDIKKLKNFYLGEQPILDRTKVIRPEVNNKVVLNFAWSTTREINGYTFGKPVIYVQRGESDSIRNSVSVLNDLMSDIDKHSIDLSIGETASVCGTSYVCCLPSQSVVGADDDIPFSIEELDPENTVIAYYSGAHNIPVIAITYYDSEYKGEDCYIITAYTNEFIYTFRVINGNITDISQIEITNADIIDKSSNVIGVIPIVEYPNNKWRVGDWEMATSILNAINNITSDNVNDIEQFVSSILVLLNAELPETEAEDPATGEMVSLTDYSAVAKGILSLVSESGINVDAKYISKQLDSSSIKQILNLLMSAWAVICGIPDRKTQETSGDTGQAVEMRDGWQDINIVADSKEIWYKKSEKRLLKIVLSILKLNYYKGISDLKVNDVVIKFNRNKTDNLVNKGTFISTMVSTNKFDIEDIIELSGITSDIKGMAERGKKYQEQERALEETKNTEITNETISNENI